MNSKDSLSMIILAGTEDVLLRTRTKHISARKRGNLLEQRDKWH